MNTENENFNMDEIVSIKEWLKMMLILCIPLINLIFLIKWLIGGDSINRNKTNLIRAQLIFGGIITAITVAFVVITFSLVIKFMPDNAFDNTDTENIVESNADVDKDAAESDNSGLKIKINDKAYLINIPDNYKISDSNEDIISAESNDRITDYMTVSDSFINIGDNEGRNNLFSTMFTSDDDIISQETSADYMYAIIKDSDNDYQCKFTKLIDIGADSYLQVSINAYADNKDDLKTADTYLAECKCFEK